MLRLVQNVVYASRVRKICVFSENAMQKFDHAKHGAPASFLSHWLWRANRNRTRSIPAIQVHHKFHLKPNISTPRVGVHNVVASDVRTPAGTTGSFVRADVQDKGILERIVKEHGITYIVHLASLLSAIGEKHPQQALKVNTKGIQNVLELAAQHNLRVYAPSTIAVFGPTTPKHQTPESTITQPTTMYGITKVHQELMGAYYHEKYGVDYRSLRYPGIISAKAAPGGGTTDYAIEIFHSALQTGSYECFLARDVSLPMMYMPDCLRATWELMMVEKEQLTQTTYNITAMSFTPEMLAESLRRFVPGFTMNCRPDFRQKIALTWPSTIDDNAARKDWNWSPDYLLDEMCAHMLLEIKQQHQELASLVAKNKTMLHKISS